MQTNGIELVNEYLMIKNEIDVKKPALEADTEETEREYQEQLARLKTQEIEIDILEKRLKQIEDIAPDLVGALQKEYKIEGAE